MDSIASIQQPEPLFKTSYSVALRWWHWLTFLFISGSIITALLNEALFDTRDNIPVVQRQVQSKGGAITDVQARAVAHEYSEKLWELHTFLGYGISLLLLFRIIIEFSASKEDKLGRKIRRALTFQSTTPKERYDRRHYIWVKWGYVVFYVLILLMALTGLGMAFEDVASFRSVRPELKEIHEFLQYAIYLYILAHLVGVFRAEVTDNKGIVSSMINGGPQ